EEDPEEEEEDPEEDSEEDDDDVLKMDDEAEVIKPYMSDGSNNPLPLNSKDEETPLTSSVVPDTDERINTERRMKNKFKEQDRYFVGLDCDNIEMDRAVRNMMSDLSGLKKLVKDLSDRFDEYEGRKVSKDKKVLEKELVNEKNRKEFYQEFDEYMCRMLQKGQKSEDGFPLPLGSQVREPPVEPSARHVPAPYPDDPYVVTRDAAIAAAAAATSGIDDDDIAPMDSQPYEPRGSPHDTQGNPPPSLTQDTVNRMIQESVEAAIRAERERVQNEANHAGGPNVAPEEDPEEEEEDPEEDSEEDDDDVLKMDDEAEVIEPYMSDGSNNPLPPNSKDEETPLTSSVVPDTDG
nr:hypothetical protein [Tanacetum cinerariifolium]